MMLANQHLAVCLLHCAVCGKKFLRNKTKRHASSTLLNQRYVNAVTCSTKCSKLYSKKVNPEIMDHDVKDFLDWRLS